MTLKDIVVETAELKPMSEADEMVALKRRWHQTYPDKEIPEEIGQLRKLFPPDLEPEKVLRLLHGALSEATSTFYKIFNTSWTKADFNNRIREEVVESVIDIIPEQTRGEILDALKDLPDE